MTEMEWLNCENPLRMLSAVSGRATKRRLQLYSVACARNIIPFMKEPHHQCLMGYVLTQIEKECRRSGKLSRNGVYG